jgi:hypothetical protein
MKKMKCCEYDAMVLIFFTKKLLSRALVRRERPAASFCRKMAAQAQYMTLAFVKEILYTHTYTFL